MQNEKTIRKRCKLRYKKGLASWKQVLFKYQGLAVVNAFVGGLVQREDYVVIAVFIQTHILLRQNTAAREEHFILILGAANTNGLGQCNFFVVELVLHLADGEAETVRIHGVGGFIVSAEDNAPVFHGGYAQDGGGYVDHRVDVGEVHVQHGVGAGRAVTVRQYLQRGEPVKIDVQIEEQIYYSQILHHKDKWCTPFMEYFVELIHQHCPGENRMTE